MIDLLDQTAVHAVGGQRRQYQPVPCCGGDAELLADFYRDCGIRQLYIADLNALAGRPIQAELIARLCARAGGERVWLDIGWKGDRSAGPMAQVARLADRFDTLAWIAATESMVSRESFDLLVERVGTRRCYLGLDFRGDQLLTALPTFGDPATGGTGKEPQRLRTRGESDPDLLTWWVEWAVDRGAAGAVILDLASVGRGAGPSTVDVCRRVHRMAPDWVVVSGGGMRSPSDVAALVAAGCQLCLVATAIQRLAEWGTDRVREDDG